jgi:polyferredoxin
MEGDDRLITLTVTAGWAVALVVVLILTGLSVLPGRDRWWDWTCGLGLAMGLFGLWYVPRLKRSRAGTEQRRAEQRRAEAQDSGVPQ